MAFAIPNHADAFSAFQAEPDSVDFDILAAGYSGNGFISGCAVTAQSTPDMTVAVAAGIISVAGVRVAVTGTNSTIGTADGSNPRCDLITINNSGTVATTAGTAAAVPELPSIPSNSVVVALVFVPASDTAIATNQIIDKRVFLSASGGVLDNIIMGIGSDSDIAILNRSTSLSADAEVTNVIEGTSDHLGVAANSLIISNITNDGDIMFLVSDAGNSKGLLKLDGANGRVVIHGGDLLMSGAQKIYFYDVGGEYMESDGSTLTITGATALTPTIGSTAWANANHTHAGSSTGGTIALSAATGTLAIGAGGTGATSLSNLITLGTHTTGNYAATVANATNGGTTIANSGSESAAITVALNFNDLTAAAVNVAADSIPFLDADGNATRIESIADLATAMAGTNLTASSGQLVAGAAGASLGLVVALGG